MSDELGYEEDERYFNVETYARWYEAIEKAVVIWLYYLGIRVQPGRLRGRVHRYHEAVLETLGHPDNPFFEIFSEGNLLDGLRTDKRLRNKWRHDNLPVPNPFETWEDLAEYLRIVNDALEDTLVMFGEKRVEIW